MERNEGIYKEYFQACYTSGKNDKAAIEVLPKTGENNLKNTKF